ncbi:UNVERIFIED_CONTAM: hypothetical protein FKN15_049656 [Acipenser sinensis]
MDKCINLALPNGRGQTSCVIRYPVEVTSAKAKKLYKNKLIKLMKESPETLIADCSLAGGKRTKTNLLFYTEHPTAWHTALCTAHSNIKLGGICKGRQLRIGDETDPDSTRLSINVFYNGTIMIQGTEASLELIEKDFQALKELAEKEKKNQEPPPKQEHTGPPPRIAQPCAYEETLKNTSLRSLDTSSTHYNSPAEPSPEGPSPAEPRNNKKTLNSV